MSKFEEWVIANTPEPAIINGLKTNWYMDIGENSVTWTCYKFGDESATPEELRPRTVQTPEDIVEIPLPDWVELKGVVYWGRVFSEKLFRSEAEERAQKYLKDLEKFLNL